MACSAKNQDRFGLAAIHDVLKSLKPRNCSETHAAIMAFEDLQLVKFKAAEVIMLCAASC
jgi:hypothetical protein